MEETLKIRDKKRGGGKYGKNREMEGNEERKKNKKT